MLLFRSKGRIPFPGKLIKLASWTEKGWESVTRRSKVEERCRLSLQWRENSKKIIKQALVKFILVEWKHTPSRGRLLLAHL